MKCATVITTTPDIIPALDGLCDRLSADLDGARPSLLVAYYTPHHRGEVGAIRDKLLERLDPEHLLGCPAIGIIGEDVEVEGQAGLTLWAGHFPGVEIEPFRLETITDESAGEDGDTQATQLTGWPERVPEDPGFLLLVDPYTTPADDLLAILDERHPGAPVLGGMASGATGPGDALLMTTEGLHDSGSIGIAVGGSVRLAPVVSQGCRPIGHHFVITAADRNVIKTLGGKPALSQLRSLVDQVTQEDRELMQRALHVGRVVDERKSTYEQGDFLVRNVLGINPDNESIAISDFVRAGQTIQFMVRDAEAASAEFEELLQREADTPALGALLFSCNGRGQRFFGVAHHDVRRVHNAVGEVPTSGFFAAGEIGPVGGKPFLHGFTASVALFKRRD